MMMESGNLSSFFSPRGVIVIGASHDPTKLGYGLARNLVLSNYQGGIYFINPRPDYRDRNLFGRPIYASVKEVSQKVDLALLLIPARAIPAALRECGECGIPAAVISAGGFRESGPDGASLEEECLKIARRYGVRIIGPNSVGYLDTHLPIDATFLPPPGPLPGEVAFISHSGAICAAVIDWARGQSFGLSRLVSLGNQADVCETDVLAAVAADPFTKVLTLYLEGVRDGRRFVNEASKVTPHKPIIALKVGRYSGGQRAVASHTGALAGSEHAYEAAFRRAGVIRADTSEEMFDWARVLAWCPPLAGRSVAVLTNAGGPGATASDALEFHGLKLTLLSPASHTALAEILPSAASLNNPVDMLASASPEQYAACLRVLLDDPGVDCVLVILPPPPMYTAGAVAKTLIPVIHASQKPVVVALMGERLIQEAVEHFRAARVPEYRFPERAASALAVLARRAEYLQRRATSTDLPGLSLPSAVKESAQEVLKPYLSQAGAQPVPGHICVELLRAYGIPVPPTYLASTVSQAVELAKQVGFPVALKASSADLAHKSDAGGVLLHLEDEDQVRQGFQIILDNVSTAHPQAVIQGVIVQKMIPEGQEVIIGAVQDPQFGPLMMFGSGGIEVEELKDICFSLAPLTLAGASFLLENTWAGRKLRGFRNLPPADREGVVQTLLRLSQLAADFPELSEIEINPLRVLPAGQGVFALDIRATVD